MLGGNCSPCCGPAPPCGCSSQAFAQLQNLLFSVSFFNFGVSRTFGTDSGNACDCDAQYGFAGSTIASQAPFLNAWRSHFNSLTAVLSFHSATAAGVIWKGEASNVSTPSGGTASYYFKAEAACGSGVVLFSRDESRGCQSNVGFTTLTASTSTVPPIAFAPSLQDGFGGGAVLVSCGGLVVRSSYTSGSASTQVFCAAVGPAGCLESAGCGGDYYRAAFSGNFAATVTQNTLP